MNICITESLGYTPEINTTLQINSIPRPKKKKANGFILKMSQQIPSWNVADFPLHLSPQEKGPTLCL